MWLDPRLLGEVADAAGVERTSATLEPGPTRPRRLPALVSMLEREIVDREAGWLRSADALVESIALDLLRASAPRSASGRPTDARIRAAVDAMVHISRSMVTTALEATDRSMTTTARSNEVIAETLALDTGNELPVTPAGRARSPKEAAAA